MNHYIAFVIVCILFLITCVLHHDFYERCDLLILDEWLLVTTNNIEQQDILEVLEKRYRVHSTILCSQFDVAGWHSKLGGGALADAILDRIVSKSQTIKIKGDKSMRSR